MKILLAFFFASTWLWAEESPTHGLRDNAFFSDEVGWIMPVPEGWEVMSAERVEALDARGEASIEEHTGVEVDRAGLINLLHLQRDDYNAFQSTAELFVEEYDGEWKDNNEALKGVLRETYQNAGLGVMISETRIETVDGVVFETYTCTLSMPDGSELMKQTLYSSLIRGYDFGASISYNNENDRDEILAAWRNSTFAKSD
jgi:hypothetical protein